MRTKINTFMVILALLSLCWAAHAATHVFWYKAVERGYALQDNSPGPGIPAAAEIHEGLIATGGVAQHSGSSISGWFCGSGLDDQQGRCGFVWSKSLCDATGSVTSAKFRGEYRDGWCGNALNNSGAINIRCGIVDFQGNLDTWGGADYVPETADWQDFLNPLSSAMGYDFMTPTLQQEETINYTAPAGRSDEFAASVLDGQFLEVDITDQVNWILQNSGQYGIVFLVAPNEGNTGKINCYADEETLDPLAGCASDNPWTTDGNTVHILAEGDLSVSVEDVPVLVSKSISLGQNTPNPFRPSTTIPYNLGHAKQGTIHIYGASGRLVHSEKISGKGSVTWNARHMASGIYLCRLIAGEKMVSRQMILMR
jgi:hypothetical protein